MARAVISPSPLLGTILPSKFSQNNGLYSFPSRSKLFSNRVNSSFQDFAPSSIGNSVDFNGVLTKAESLLYTLADAAVSASPDAGAPVQKNGGWFGFISDAMEVVLKVIVFLQGNFSAPGLPSFDSPTAVLSAPVTETQTQQPASEQPSQQLQPPRPDPPRPQPSTTLSSASNDNEGFYSPPYVFPLLFTLKFELIELVI
ncbi:hypothetical protein Cgig2_005317 [Carnegiea gigantea]|uniref:Uncharacterized protein n=1 Tax=Carnegiea gigantea TaxID=171969 RepID=A0A9Q1JGK5_9CARY|nr:hypothetical protein Cgig2_005317 [Carnegiea gigantea]